MPNCSICTTQCRARDAFFGFRSFFRSYFLLSSGSPESLVNGKEEAFRWPPHERRLA